MTRSVAYVSAGVVLLLALRPPFSHAQAAGVWFDIGADREVYVHSGDALAWEYFPPFTFGPSYPPGTLVYARVSHITCHDFFPLSCDTAGLVTAYVAFFNDGGCGCGGYPNKPIKLRMYYDEDVVNQLGVSENDLGVIHYEWDIVSWVPIEVVVVNAEENYVEADVTGWMLAEQYYAVIAGNPTPVLPSRWGTLKIRP